MAEAVGFEPTCPCGQLHFECSSLQPLRYASMYKYSLLGTNHMISSQGRYDHFDTYPYIYNETIIEQKGRFVKRKKTNFFQTRRVGRKNRRKPPFLIQKYKKTDYFFQARIAARFFQIINLLSQQRSKRRKNMPDLSCEARNCAHNKDSRCSIECITVGGRCAKKPNATCCENFTEQTTPETLTNVGRPHLSIDCQAKNCRYNSDCSCFADAVNICGCDACDCKETECSTFRIKH